jgi:hypothetical protein
MTARFEVRSLRQNVSKEIHRHLIFERQNRAQIVGFVITLLNMLYIPETSIHVMLGSIRLD